DLALEAFEYTSRYDGAIFNYLAKRQGQVLPPALRLAYDKIADLRYGENPYQKAALYRESFPYAATATAERLQGKELSYNNLIDLDAALRIVTEFDRPAADEEGRLPEPADERRAPKDARHRHGPRPRGRPPPDDGLPGAEARGIQGGHEDLSDRGPDAGHLVRDHGEPLRQVELDRPRER